MSNLHTAKIFGTGQITLPKKWRDNIKTKNIIIEEVPQGLLIKPLTESVYYDLDTENFGINFPMGMEAGKLADDLEQANERLS